MDPIGLRTASGRQSGRPGRKAGPDRQTREARAKHGLTTDPYGVPGTERQRCSRNDMDQGLDVGLMERNQFYVNLEE
jgi:hypothetical protein